MAELHRVEINEKAPNEIEPVDETVETPEEQQAEPQAEETQERPEWLPAVSYTHLTLPTKRIV